MILFAVEIKRREEREEREGRSVKRNVLNENNRHFGSILEGLSF